MPDDIKRLNYFTGEFLEEADFNLEQAYQLRLQRDHERLLHTPGVAEGLDIPPPLGGAETITVNAGTAYDGLGRRIVLVTDKALDLSSDGTFPEGSSIYVTIRYGESKTDEEISTGIKGDSRWTETPIVEAKTTAPVANDPNYPLLLAVVTKNAGLTVNSAGRLIAGTKGGDFTVNSLTLTNPLLAQGSKLQLGPTGMTTFDGGLTVTGAGGLTVNGAAGLTVTGNVAVTGTVDGRDVGNDGAALTSHLASTSNPHQTTAAQVDTQGGVARIVTQINAGTGVVAEPRIDALIARQSALNTHLNNATGAHAASAISAATHNAISGTTVQAQLQEIVTDLASQTGPTTGASTVGNDAFGTAPNNVAAGNVRSQLSLLLNLLTGNVANVSAALASQVGPGSGASLVGNDAFGTAPNNVAGGTVRAQLPGLLNLLTGHLNNATGAHAATAISVADAANNLNAVNAETALTEVMAGLTADHFRQVDSVANQGQHRTIHQPQLPDLGGGRRQLFDSNSTGLTQMRFRIYSDASSVWFLLNTFWNGSNWQKDVPASPAAGFRISGSDFEFLCEPSGLSAFVNFPRRWLLPMGVDTTTTPNTGFEQFGSARETVAIALTGSNPSTVAATVYIGGQVTFRSRLQSSPSSVTFTTGGAQTLTGTPFAWNLSRDGFSHYFFQNLAAGQTNCWWNGTYTAIF